MKILVTGANGQVGFLLAMALRNTAWEFQAVTREQLNIADKQAVFEVVEAYRPDIVINAAAYTAVDKAEVDMEAAFQINRDGAHNLALAAKAVNAAIFHISTDYVFAGNSNTPYTETDETGPQGIYGKSKLEGELVVAAANEKHIILRTAWVFGEHGNNFVKTMIRLGRDRETLGIVGDQNGGPTYAGDIAQALLTIVSRVEQQTDLPWGIYHFSGHPHVSWFEFAVAIFASVENANIYEKAIPTLTAIKTTDYPTPAKRPANSRLDCSKIKDNFGVEPSDWKKALENIQAYA